MNSRLDQVNWLQFVAAGLVNDSTDITGHTIEEVVANWEQNTELPDWYDKDDHDILARFVKARLIRQGWILTNVH